MGFGKGLSPRLATPQADQKTRVRNQLHGSDFFVELLFTEASITSFPGRCAVSFASIKFKKAPRVPGSGTIRFTTLENDSFGPRFQTLRRV